MRAAMCCSQTDYRLLPGDLTEFDRQSRFTKVDTFLGESV